MANLNPQDHWNPLVLGSHPLFWPVVQTASGFAESYKNWPTLTDYQRYLNTNGSPVYTRSSHPLTIVPQDESPQEFSDGYEPRIYLKGELQTRQHSWHDFFQVLVWKIFPFTKGVINELHFNAIKARLESENISAQRSGQENMLTQFDECGGIIVSPDIELLELVRQFDWHTLFWKKRAQIEQRLKCVVFGHAIYEKAVKPYLGMTCHSVLIQLPENIFFSRPEDLLKDLDTRVAHLFLNAANLNSPQDLSPFPLLGIPGWHSENNQESFYDNKDYFRPGRKQKNQFSV